MAFNLIYFFIITAFMVKFLQSKSISAANDKLELVFLNVVFRHGSRAPDNNGDELYPTDPYRNHNFDPVGFGGLTLKGKREEYDLGVQLRRHYDHFLGATYMPYMVMARSTDYDRTKMSLLLVLSGLYPPKDEQVWNNHLKWQPIPFTYFPSKYDILLAPDRCSLYIEELNRVRNSKFAKAQTAEFHSLMKHLTHWTGKKFHSSTDMFNLYHTLMAEHTMGLELPKWTDDIFPNGQLLNGTILEYYITSYNTELRRLNGGMLLRNITDTMYNIARGTTDDRRKINLFSGHETNVAAFLLTLGVYKPHVPQYSSGVIVELLRDSNNNYYVGLQHYLGIPSKMEALQIPGCDVNCPLEEFMNLLKDVVPSDEEMKCSRETNEV